MLFDTREALQRDAAPAGVERDPRRRDALRRARRGESVEVVQGTAPFNGGSGVNANIDNGGFTVYFSDRRNNRNSRRTVRPANTAAKISSTRCPRPARPTALLDAGEDVNAQHCARNLRRMPNYNGVYAPCRRERCRRSSPARDADHDASTPGQAQVNRAILFRHALKLVNGSTSPARRHRSDRRVREPGLRPGRLERGDGAQVRRRSTIRTRRPRSSPTPSRCCRTTGTTRCRSRSPTRRATATAARQTAGIAWRSSPARASPSRSRPEPATDFGTDGGAHNFLRYLENGDQPVNYRGSMATFFYNRQAVGTFKCCTTVYARRPETTPSTPTSSTRRCCRRTRRCSAT